MPDLPDEIARINALTTNARNTWFALPGVLVFVGITLMGVEHIDFYGVDRATKLPLVDVDVPTRYFFVAAPIFVAAIYCYLHLYLIRLWDALSDADAQFGGRPLGNVIAPWLVTDAALQIRRKLRKEEAPCNAHRTLETPAMLLNMALAWLFGLIVLFLIWWQSMPARTFWITGIAGLALTISLFAGAASLAMMVIRMKSDGRGAAVSIWSSVPAMASLLVICPAIMLFGHQRTEGVAKYLAPVLMIGEEIVERPGGWLSYKFARAEFRAKWCVRENIEYCSELANREDEFEQEWRARRDIAISELKRPSWDKWLEQKPDFRRSAIISSFLAGADLRGAKLENITMWHSDLEGIDLRRTNLVEIDFLGAQLSSAKISSAEIEKLHFREAEMSNADLAHSTISETNFSETQMDGINFLNSNIKSSNFYENQMDGANFRGAQLDHVSFGDVTLGGANFKFAKLKDTDFGSAEMQDVVFDHSYLFGTGRWPRWFASLNLNGARNQGGAMRNLRIQHLKFDKNTDFRNIFLDNSVEFPSQFAAQMGAPQKRPCQWVNAKLSDEEFLSIWRWWYEKHPDRPFWSWVWPEDIPLPTEEQLAKYKLTDCEWKTGPMPGND